MSDIEGTAPTLGKYQVRAVIGRGAMGTVLEAWDPVIDRRVAVKTVKLPGAQDAEMAEELQRFRREAQAAGRLSHPNIVGVYDYGETADLAFIVMEFVDGRSVKALLDSHERFAPAAVARLMEDLLGGLDYSHRAGVIHRDIKPANIMLTKEGQAKIADFGIARIESSSMTQPGTLLGTPAYMSPEQFRGETVDLRTDVYSSGVLLYQLLTGERPFEGSLSSIMHKALTTEPPPPSSLSAAMPRAMDAVVLRAMAKRPDERYPSAAAFLAAIRAAMAPPASDETVFARPGQAAEAAPAPPPPRPRRSRLPLLLGAGVAVAAAAAGVVFLAPSNRPNVASLAPALVASVPAPDRPAARPSQPSAPLVIAPANSPAAVDAPAPTQFASATPAVPAPVLPIPAPPAARQPEPASPFIVPVLPASPPAGVETPAPTQPVSAIPPAPTPPARDRIAAALEALPCTAVIGDLQPDGAAWLRGFTAPNGLPGMQDALAAAGARLADPASVAEADPSYCGALSAVSPLLQPLGATAPLMLTEAADRPQLADGDYIRPRVQMPPFAASLIVDYYAHDGTVEHVFPRLGDPAHKIPADPGHPFAPGERVALGDPGGKHASFQVGEPYGRDMIIAVASAQPLFPAGRPRNGEQSAPYARDLRAAIEQARARGVRLSAGVIRLDTVAR